MSGYRRVDMISSDTVSATTQTKPATRQSEAILAEVLGSRTNQIIFIALTAVISILYTILLPFGFTQRFSFANWQYLDPYLSAWSVLMGAGMSLVIVLQIHSMRRIRSTQTSVIGGFAFIGSILPSFLCCTPIIPTLLAFIGLSTVSIYGTTGTLQHFFAVNQTAFLFGSALLLAISGWWSVRSISKADCLNDACCDTNAKSFPMTDSATEASTLNMTTKGANQ